MTLYLAYIDWPYGMEPDEQSTYPEKGVSSQESKECGNRFSSPETEKIFTCRRTKGHANYHHDAEGASWGFTLGTPGLQ